MLALPLPFPSHALIAILQLSWKGVVLVGGIFSMAFQQCLWIAYTPEDGNIWSSCVLTLHDTGAITFGGRENGGKWSYTSTSGLSDCPQLFFMEFHGSGKKQHPRRHCFQQIAETEAVLLPNGHEAYTIAAWSQESSDHKNKLDIFIKKVELPTVGLLKREAFTLSRLNRMEDQHLAANL